MRAQNAEIYDKYYGEWKQGDYNLYTGDIFTESIFVADISEKTKQPLRYKEYLEEIIAKESGTLEISIFAGSTNKPTDEDAFSKKVIKKTAAKYKRIGNINTEIYSYKWIDNITSQVTTDSLLVLVSFILVYQMIYEEKKKQLFGVIRAMPRGRTNCILSKTIALFINTGCATVLMYAAVIAYSGVTVGIHGMNAPIQSVATFISCPYKLNV